jgi:hypothetical protein
VGRLDKSAYGFFGSKLWFFVVVNMGILLGLVFFLFGRHVLVVVGRGGFVTLERMDS